jgi:hypothetical protein
MERGIRVPWDGILLSGRLQTCCKMQHADISQRMTMLLEDMVAELAALNQRIGAFDDEISVLASCSVPACGGLGLT